MNGADDRAKRYLQWAQIAAGFAIIALVVVLFLIDAGSKDFELPSDKLGLLLVAGCALLGIALRGTSK